MTLFRPAERRDVVVSGSPTFNPFENPSVPLAAVGLDSVFSVGNATDSGEQVTIDKSLVVPTVWRCVNLLANVVAACPLNVYKRPDAEPKVVPVLSPDNFDTTYTPFELWRLVVAYLALWGNAYVFKKRSDFETIIDLKPLHPALVEVKLDRGSGRKIFLVKRLREDGSVNESEKPQVFTDYEIMHITGLGVDGLTGLSCIALGAQAIGTSIAADKLAARFYKSGTMLGGIIKVKAPLANQAQAEGIKARWMQKNAGVGHAGDVAVLDAETDFQDITIPPDQLQFLESRRWNTTELARMFGVPPHMVGDVERSTSWGTGIEEQTQGFISFTVEGFTAACEQRTTREVVNTRAWYAEFDLSRLMRGTTLERYQAYQIALASGWITGNEVRKKENLRPLDGLDKPFPPLGINPQGAGAPNPSYQNKGNPNGE